MSRVKNQHYVPQCYLERFTDHDGRLHVFDKATGRNFCTGVRNVASEMSFYDLPGNLQERGISPQAVEQHFGKVEGELAEILRLLTSEADANRKFPEEAKDILAPHLATLRLRTKEFRTQLGQTTDYLSGLLQDMGHTLPEQRTPALNHARFMFDPRTIPTLAAALRGHIWLVARNETAHPLYTSDAPIVCIPHQGSSLLPNSGIASPGIEIVFPFSPCYALVLRERAYFADQAIRDRGMFLLSDDGVRVYNSAQVLLSYQRIFCSRNDFDLARQTMAACPEESDPNRQRYTHD
jgi:hypothetical protein